MKERSGRRWSGVRGVEGRDSEVDPGARRDATVEEEEEAVDSRAGAGAEVTSRSRPL